MVVTECPKIFDVQCIWGRVLVSHIFLGIFFGQPYRSNVTKIHLDAALHITDLSSTLRGQTSHLPLINKYEQ